MNVSAQPYERAAIRSKLNRIYRIYRIRTIKLVFVFILPKDPVHLV